MDDSARKYEMMKVAKFLVECPDFPLLLTNGEMHLVSMMQCLDAIKKLREHQMEVMIPILLWLGHNSFTLSNAMGKMLVDGLISKFDHMDMKEITQYLIDCIEHTDGYHQHCMKEIEARKKTQ